MPYSQITLVDLITQISILLDDYPAQTYWVPNEIRYAVWEALRVFGSVTAYWRQRGVFNISPLIPNSITPASPFSDMSALLPALRSRSVTLQSIVSEIEYHLLENVDGTITGGGFSGQVSINTILSAIARARNRFCIDTHLPNVVHQNFTSTPPPSGSVGFPQSSVFVHRVSWQDAGGAWANLWRDDAWVYDHSDAQWPVDPGMPQSYSEAELAPLQFQLYPPPLSEGTIEAITVDSLLIDTTDPNSTLAIPDEWSHAVKYAAMEEILTGGNQLVDPVRAQYCAARYKQAVAFAKDARSIIRLTLNGNPLAIDSMAAIDAGQPFWRNQTGPPQMAGILYDIACINPGIPDQNYAIGADLVTPAPLPQMNDFIQIGEENLQDLADYAVNYLLLKCGGNEFKSTMGLLDNFQRAMATRKGVNAAKIRYYEPLFGMWKKEESERPDAMDLVVKSQSQ